MSDYARMRLSIAFLSRQIARIQRVFDARLIRKSGAFDRAWYLEKYPDVASANIDPLLHFVCTGHSEGRFPNAIFDTAWYLAEGLESSSNANPLVDYLRRGIDAARRPNRFFDPVWYRSQHGLAVGIDPMTHYLTMGAADDLNPNPDFDAADFKKRYPGTGIYSNPFTQFLHRYLVKGCIGDCTSYFVTGWASRIIGPQVRIWIFVNGTNQGDVTPWLSRPDVTQALGLEALGFFFVFPTRLQSGDRIELRDEFDRLIDDAYTTYRVPALTEESDLYGNRAAIAAAFIRGHGIEFGAFTQPTDLPPECEVLFYDARPAEQLREFYDETCGRPLFEPQRFGDAEKIEGVSGETFDFIIANHVIEHMEDPIGFLSRVAEILNDGGRAMIAAPDKRYSFDEPRPITTFEHVVQDHELGPHISRAGHYVEFVQFVEKLEGEAANRQITVHERNPHLCHYHVWDAQAFISFIDNVILKYGLPFNRLYARATKAETIIILERLNRPRDL